MWIQIEHPDGIEALVDELCCAGNPAIVSVHPKIQNSLTVRVGYGTIVKLKG